MIKVIKKVTDVIIILIITLLAGYFVLRFFGKVAIFKIQTGSMETKIHVGDYVLAVKNKEINDNQQQCHQRK